jgi:thioredoxin reductase (NADPH)
VKVNPVNIIGGGPAGLAAALQLTRYEIPTLLFEHDRLGGLLWNANLVENYPGFPEGITGPALVKIMIDQAVSGRVKIIQQEVLNLSFNGDHFQVMTSNRVYLSHSIVIATGTKPKTLRDLTIPEALHQKVYYEIYPLLSLVGKQIMIVGGGDAAFDYALNLGKENYVIIVNRSTQVKCLPLLWQQVSASKNIAYRPNTTITRVLPGDQDGMAVECSSPDGSTILHADYLIVAIGRAPSLDFVSTELLEQSPALEKRGILHFVGDVKNDIFRQTAIACGDGIRAGMCIYQALKESSSESDCLDRKRRHRHRLHR